MRDANLGEFPERQVRESQVERDEENRDKWEAARQLELLRWIVWEVCKPHKVRAPTKPAVTEASQRTRRGLEFAWVYGSALVVFRVPAAEKEGRYVRSMIGTRKGKAHKQVMMRINKIKQDLDFGQKLRSMHTAMSHTPYAQSAAMSRNGVGKFNSAEGRQAASGSLLDAWTVELHRRIVKLPPVE